MSNILLSSPLISITNYLYIFAATNSFPKYYSKPKFSMQNRVLLIFFSIFLLSFSSWAQEKEEVLTWPREIETTNVLVTLYQPQLESFENNVLVGRMALSVKPQEKDLVFGAIWFSAKLITDLDTRTAALEKIDITQIHFPEVDPVVAEQFKTTLEKEIEGQDVEISLDRLLASLELIESRKDLSDQINNDPPDIYFRTSPAVLVSIDGEPIMKDTEEKEIQYVVNTPYFIVSDSKTGKSYVKGAKWWYAADAIEGPYSPVDKVPSKVNKLAKEQVDDEGIENDSALMAMEAPPELILVTKPSELVVTDGEPDYGTVESTQLLYVKNSENDIVMNINTQEHYVLLAGRWYTSRSLKEGDWKFAEPEDLPEDFEKIPAESDMGNVRSSIPGTEEANMALLEQSIPQTATVDRKNATLEVSYDGTPEFKPVEGTSMQYAVNTDKQVLLIDGIYYCVEDGVWFESKTTTGPWSVSTERPDQVEEIPPDNPNYNVKYVYIYDYSPDVVYVGYLPGYTCSYVYNGVVVYGTGYYYYPWYSTYYYPRPVTWGFGVHYNPWTGWGFSFGVSNGWMTVSFRSSYWGPGGYRYGYRHGYHRGYHHGYRHGYARGARAGYAAGQRQAVSNNVYRNRSNGVRSTGVDRSQATAKRAQAGNANRVQAGNTRKNQPTTMDRQGNAAKRSNTNNQVRSRPSTKENNVYTDRNGNIQRRDNNGNWEQRSNSNNSWNRSSGNNQSGRQNMNRDYRSRQQGAQRQQNYNRSNTRTGGASRGGGMRRK